MTPSLYTFVAIAPCGCIRGAVVDDNTHMRSVRKFIDVALLAGYAVSKVPTADVRFMSWRCTRMSCPFQQGGGHNTLVADPVRLTQPTLLP